MSTPEKSFIAVDPNSGATYRFNETDWQEKKDRFVSKYPDAEIMEYDTYNPEDTKENDDIFVSTENGAYSFSPDEWAEKQERFMTKYPKASVGRVRAVNYWGDKAAEQEQAIKEKRQSMMSVPQNATELWGNNPDYLRNLNELEEMAKAYKENPYVQQKAEEEKSSLRKLKEATENDYAAFMKEYEDVIAAGGGGTMFHQGSEDAMMQGFARSVGAMRKGKDHFGRQVEYDMQKPLFDAALQNISGAEDILDKPNQSENNGNAVANVFKGIGARYGSAEFWSRGMTKLVALNNGGNEAIEKINRKLQSAGDGITEEDIDKILSPAEKAYVFSLMEVANSEAQRAPIDTLPDYVNAERKVSRAYQIGEGIAEMTGFIAEFIATGNITDAATSGATKVVQGWLIKNLMAKGGKALAQKAARGLSKVAVNALTKTASAAMKSAVRTAAMGATGGLGGNIATQRTTLQEDGTFKGTGESILGGTYETAVENFTEEMGPVITDLLGAPFKPLAKPIKDYLKGIDYSDFGKLESIAKKVGYVFDKSTPMAKALAKGGYHGTVEEYGEELLGALIRGEMDQFFDKDQQLVLIGTFAPMAVLGMGGSAAHVIRSTKEVKAAAENLRLKLKESGIDDKQIDYLTDYVRSTSAEKMGKEFSSLIGRMAQESGLGQSFYTSDTYKAVARYIKAVAEYQTIDSQHKEQEGQQRTDKQAELEEKYGKFYNQSDNSVNVVQLKDGKVVYQVTDFAENGEAGAVDMKDGKPITFRAEDVQTYTDKEGKTHNQESGKMSLDSYLSSEIMKRKESAQTARMREDRQRQINELTQSLPNSFDLGTEADPYSVAVKSHDANGVTVVDEKGNEMTLPWDKVGRLMNKPIKVLTDSELAEAEAAEMALKVEAVRAKNAKTSKEAQEVETDTAAIDEEVKSLQPNPEDLYTDKETGEVDEVEFWKNDPEGYCEWNDKRQQDGGIDSMKQIANARTALEGVIKKAEKEAKTDNPVTRRTAEGILFTAQQQLDKYAAIEQQYAERNSTQEEKRAEEVIAMRERASFWREKLNLGDNLVVLESLDEVKNPIARRTISLGRTEGWYDNKEGKVYLYLPDIASTRVLDKKVMHEIVTHYGLDHFLNESEYAKLTDMVWNIMSDTAKRNYYNYTGVSSIKDPTMRRRRAAEEFIAKVAEDVNFDNANAETKSIWQRILDFFKKLFEKDEINLAANEIAEALNKNIKGLVVGNEKKVEEFKAQAAAQAQTPQETAQPEVSQSEVDTQVETILNESGLSVMEDAPMESMTNIVDAATQEPAAIDFAPEADDFLFSTKTENYLAERIRGYAKTKEGKKAGWTPEMVEDIIAETQALITAIHNASTGNEFYDEFAAKDPTIKLDWRDGQLKPTVTWTRGNIEYKYDMSADLLCVNNEGLEEVLSSEKMVALMELFNMSKKDEITTKTLDGKEKTKKVEIGFSQDDYLELYNTLKDLGFVVPCKGCFDAAGRFKMLPSVAYKFAAAVNAVIDERNADPEAFDAALKSKVKKNAATNGLPTSAKTKLDAIRAGVAGDNLTEHVKWTQLMSADGQTKMLSDWGGIFRAWQRTGAGRPKDKLLPEPYYGDIVSSHTTIIGAYGDKTPSFRDIDVNQGTGLRRNSHSEFRPVLAVDEIQFMRDAYIKGLTVFKYMKELDDVRLFGKMGVKFNMSFFPEFVPGTKAAGLDKDGNYIPSEESVGAREFPYTGEDGKVHYDGMKGWQEAQKHINKDVSLSSVILSIPHLIKALTDVPTTFDKSGIWGSLIPFHSSGATSLALFLQGLGRARANGVGHGFEEAFTRYDEGVTNFEAVQNDRFGKGWVIVEGKEDKVGTAVEEGHKLEFVNGKHYYNSEMGLHLFASMYIFDSELPEGALNEDGTINLSAKELKKIAHKYEIDYNNKVREIGTPTAYAEAADYYLDLLPKLGLKPRFDFDVPEDVFLQMCEDAKVDPTHPKLGWKGKGHAWNPIHSAAYYSLFCDYGMTDPATGEWAPHNPVGYVNENGEREFRMPENTVQIVKEGLDRYSGIRRSESAKIDEAINEFAKRSVEKGRISKEAAESVLGEGLLFSTIGERGALNDKTQEGLERLNNLEVARQMESELNPDWSAKEDENALKIKIASGWERGADGKWRYEIPDGHIVENPKIERTEWVTDMGDKRYEYVGKLSDVYDSPELYRAYPFLKDVTIEINPYSIDGETGFYSAAANLIKVVSNYTKWVVEHSDRFKYLEKKLDDALENVPDDEVFKFLEEYEKTEEGRELNELGEKEKGHFEAGFPDYERKGSARRTLIHEIQHAIQKHEGFAKGTSVRNANYRRYSGEVESRNAEKRMDMSPEERRNTLLAATEDVDRKDQIILMDAIGVSHMGSRTDRKMFAIGEYFKDRNLSSIERAIVDVYSQKADNEIIEIAMPDGSSKRIKMRQGNEPKAGTKHSAFRHFQTRENYITEEDILNIPSIIANGVRTEKPKGKTIFVEYEFTDAQGDKFIVLTEKNQGLEVFDNFYTNRKAPLSASSNTQQGAHSNHNGTKSVSKGTNNSGNGNTLFSTSNNNQAIFVSNAAKAVEGIKQDKATPEQWLKMIEKNGGLKAGEDKWMGLSDWLKASDKKTLTKAEVLDFINENMIVIEEVHYAAGAEDDAENTYAMIERVLQEKFGKYIAEYYEQNSGEDDDLYGGDSYEYAMDKLREEMNDEFPYTIERSNSVVYLTFPYEETDDLQEWADKLGIKFTPQNPINDTRLGYTTDGLENRHEIALTVPTIESWNEEDDIHFGDAGDGRAVAWIRFGETEVPTGEYKVLLDEMNRLKEVARELYEEFGGRSNELAEVEERQDELRAEMRSYKNPGLKVLIIDEIQSKRHQEGREKGYARGPKISLTELRQKAQDFEQEMIDKYHPKDLGLVPFASAMRGVWTEEESNTYSEIMSALGGAAMKNSGIPDAPFDKNWHELAMKRMLRYAAENGYDAIAWTKGEQQAERYGIGKVVSSVGYRRTDDGKRVRVNLRGGESLLLDVDVLGKVTEVHRGDMISKGMSLSEIVGADLAKQIANYEGEVDERGDYNIKSENFRIGGEGMKGFYDKMLPAFMNKYGKKWGIKVEDIELPNLEEAGQVMHSVPVTEEMKESVMEGQLMFSTKSDVNEESAVMFSTVRDPFKVAELESGKKVYAYRSVQIDDNGHIYSPMASRLKSRGRRNEAAQMREWDQSVENLDLVTRGEEYGKITILDEDGGQTKVAYNPYGHCCVNSMMNDQFKRAWERDGLYVMKVEAPESELTSGYKAEQAKDAVGIHKWKTGAVGRKLPESKRRQILLTRWMKNVQVMTWEEVAQDWINTLKGEKINVPFNVVPRKILNMLVDGGVKIVAPEKGMENALSAYNEWKKDPKGYVGDTALPAHVAALNENKPSDPNGGIRFSTKSATFATMDSRGKSLTPGQQTFFANSKAVDKDGNLLVLYHGTPRAGFTEFESGWFTTSKEDAISYSGDRKGRLFDPNEEYIPETLTAGDFPLGYMTFDSEEDRAAFLAEHPTAESALSESEYENARMQAEDEEYDALTERKPELQEIWDAYREYERDHFVDTTIGDILNNPDAYTEDDLRRAVLAYDSNAVFDSIDELETTEERKSALVDSLNYMNEDAKENGSDGILDIMVATRVPRNGEGIKHNDTSNRTYEVYANIERPYEIDADGRHSEFESGDIYKAVESALKDDNYDGIIIRNWRVGRHQQVGDVVVPKNGSQVKLTSNENPTESNDILFSTRQPYESAKAFIQTETDKFYETYNTTLPAKVVYANSRKMIAEALGYKVEEMPDALYKAIREEAKKGYACVVSIDDKPMVILVFPREDVNQTAKVSRILFHENIHPMISDKPELLDLGKWLIENPVGIAEGVAEQVKSQYAEEDWNEEMVCDYIGAMLSLGRSQEALDVVPEEYKPLLNYVYERFGYKPESEDPRRRSERLGDARELQMRNSENEGGNEGNSGYLFSTAGREKSVEEIVEEGKQKVSAEHTQTVDAFMDRIRRINGNLQQLRMAAAAQREYDQKTVKTITDIANDLLEGGALNDLTRGEIKRLLSIINGGVGKSDLTKSVNRLMDLMVANQLRYGKSLIEKFLKIRGSKVDQRGVEVRGTLDIPGQQMLAAFKEGIVLSKEKLADRIADAEDALSSDSETKRRNAENELVGLYLAKQYHEDINDSLEEENDLRNEIKKADEDYKAGKITKEMHKQLLDTIYEAILENRIQRVNAYEKLASDLGAKMVSSIKNAGLLRDAEKERVQKIQHFANSDMQGMPADEHEVKESRFWNSGLVSIITSPLVTFEQWLRVFGEKSAEGKGYLWNYFMTKWNEANNNEYKGMQEAHAVLDSMVRAMFGSNFNRWSDLFSMEKKMPTIPIQMWDNGKGAMVDKELSQGNALYIYMVNKMVDGKMKLRKMGITQDVVDAIVAQIDPRFIQLADWMQETFLPSLRDKYNAVHERLFGAPMAAIDNYFPIKVLANARVREVDVVAGEGSAKPATITGSIIKRTKNSLALDVLGSDAFDVLLEHIQQMEHWAAFAEFNKDLNTLLSYKKFRNRVQNMSGAMGTGLEAWRRFKETAEIAAGVYKPKTGSADKAFTNIVKGLTAGKISFRLWPAMKQILSMPAFAPYTSLANFGRNLATPMKAFEWAMENLPAFEKRWKSRQAGNVRLQKTEADYKMWDWMETATRIGMTPNAFVDAVTCAIGARSVYDTKYSQYIKDGYTAEQADEKAKLDATVAFNATQQSSEAAFLSSIQIDRTFVSHALTVFRNSSFGMQRELVDAVRNMRHRMNEGYKEKSIEFMKKQMIRDGLAEDKAERAAQRIYRNSTFKDAARIATFGFMMQFLWTLGGSAVYMLFGDDDEDKRKMLKEAAIRGAFGSIEGLGGGNIVADGLAAMANGTFDNYRASFTPAISDIESLVDEMKRDVVAGASDLVNLLVQMGFGVNPQIIADAAIAIYDACDGDLETSREAGILILRLLQAPQSNIDKLFTDEIDFTKDKGLDLTIEEFAQRYADYKAYRNAPYTYWIYDDEAEKKQEQKYIKRFLKDAEELKRSRGNEEAKKYYEYLDTDYKETTETINDLKRKAKESAMKGDQMGAFEYAKMLDDFMKTDLFKDYVQFGSKAKGIEKIRDKMKQVDLQTRESLEDMMLELRKEMVQEMEEASR